MSNPSSPASFSRREALILVLLIVVVLATRIPFLMHGLDEWDSANFALSVVQFAIPGDQPHAPGQFFYVRLLQLINGFTGNELFTLSLTSAVGSTLALVPYYFVLRSVFSPAVAFGASVLTAFTFGFWITSLRMISDPVATLFVYGTLCALLAGLSSRGWFLFGMALCGVALGIKQTALYFLAPLAVAINLVVLSRVGWRRVGAGSLLFAVTVLTWLWPTINNCHGWSNYLALCRAKQQENYATESIIFHLSSGVLRTQWQHNFEQPWGSHGLAVVMTLLTVGGLLLACRRGLRGWLLAGFGLTVAFYAFFFLYRFNKYYAYYVPCYCAFGSAALFAVGGYVARLARAPVLSYLVPGIAITCITVFNVSLTAPLLPRISHFRAPPQAALDALHSVPGMEATPLLLTDDPATSHELLYFQWKNRLDLLNRHPDLQAAVTALDAGRKVYFLTPVAFDTPLTGFSTVRLLGRYAWNPVLYEPLQGRADLRQLSLYELTLPLPPVYVFDNPAARPPLLLKGMWEDGWCGADSQLLLPTSEKEPGFAHLRFRAPADFDYHYPYPLVCRFPGGSRQTLTFEHAGSANFVVPLPAQPGGKAVELDLLAPQVYQISQHQANSNDQRVLSVQLEEVDCVNSSFPLLIQHAGGWYDEESDGAARWRWTDGAATLDVLTEHQGTFFLTGTLRSLSGENAVEILVDGRTTSTISLAGTDWTPLQWHLPLTAGYHKITLHSQKPGVQPPGDGRTLALCIRDFQTRLDP